MKWLFRSLRQKLLLLLTLAIVIPVGLTAVLNIEGTRNLLEAEVEERQFETTRIVAGQVNEFVRGITRDLHNIGQFAGQPTLTAGQREQYLLEYLTSSSLDTANVENRAIYDTVWVMDAEGNELVRVTPEGLIPTEELRNRHEEEIFFRPERGETYFSTVRLSSDKPQISVALPIYHDNTLISVVAAVINLDEPWEIIRNLNVGQGGYALLVDLRGNLIIHPDEALLEQRLNLADSVVVSAALNQPSQQSAIQRYSSDLVDEEVLGSAILIPGPNWILVVERPTAVAFRAEDEARQNAITAVALALLLAVAISFFLARQITRPILTLRDAARRLGMGDLSARTTPTTHDEIGELSQSFNSMAEQLADSIDQLEVRVEARTRDLQLASEVSREVTTTLQLETLLPKITILTRSSFGLYHVAIYRYDAESQLLTMTARSDAADKTAPTGRQYHMKNKQGLIVKAASTTSAVIINDVQQSPEYRYEPDLPNTRSEMALPMMVGKNLLGVLDLQSEDADAFSEDHVRVMTSLAEQLAVAIRNAELFAETEAARAAAEEADKTKSQFLANMSHELRTPLNAILNFTAFVSDGILGPVNDEQVEALEQSIASGKHLLALINDVLDLTKIESGMMDLFIQEVDINELLSALVSVTKGLIKDKPIELITNISLDLPKTFGDKRRLRQVFLNVASNAVKFTPKGQITITASCQNNEINVSIQDTGIGIAPEDHALVFESFKQAKHDLSGTIGTGLGLPISKYFVESHGGKMWLESAVDKGTTFHIVLPIHTDEKAGTLNALALAR